MASSSSSLLFNFLLPSQSPTQITNKNPPQIISAPSHCDSLPSLSSSTTTTTTTTTCSVSFRNRRNRDGFVPITPIEKSSFSSSSSSFQNDLLSVICPSLVYSNTLFFAGYHVEVVVAEDESEDSLINRFKRQVLRDRVIQDCKRRRYHENAQEKRKRKSREAARRNKLRRIPRMDPMEDKDEQALKEEEEKKKKKAMDDDDKDNWEYYEGDYY